ncbi:MAG: restriction endonuclease DpnI [Lacunisphaera sp.]|nr:restriction endonuclease DpnI [Lacunisphaera sp.]
MDLQLPTHHGVGYKSASQLARRITEPWGEDNLYCCACPSDRLSPEKANTHVRDFLCPKCTEHYQLKSHSKKLGTGILGSNYQKMLDAILGNQTPNFFLLHYQLPEWLVRNLLLIPRFAISPSVIVKRNALSATAQRSQWTGYVLNVRLIPDSAKIPLIIEGSEVNRRDVREQYARIARLETLKPEQRGWTLDVLRCVESLPQATFTNADIYAAEPELAKLYPANHHIQPKIRQQLQVLRDRGMLKQTERGVWQRL